MTISDTFGDFTPGLSSPICGGFDIVPDDAVDLQNVTRAIVLASGGDVSVVLKNGDTITLPALTAGVIYPVRVSRVLAAGTTASGIKGLI
ncbi:hypothetical protein N8Z32_02205 [Ascidiaceihabitans sp.]|jgi:hypothetical protein|nr:hypothetical protein [Paracoccaceae bacterium]MDB4073856.1 hypothetical protein [Ascidiaceihabitans sp.]MDB9946451.1 hypothetical protein [Ascidiaceihabitans sp.]MDC1275588.1 hypothetical protein [Ascidiaceihabitans sp.]HCI06792.1 hypothetical protein [Sulfitobacter sp.]